MRTIPAACSRSSIKVSRRGASDMTVSGGSSARSWPRRTWQSFAANPYYGLGLSSMQTLFVLHELLHVMDLQDRFGAADDVDRSFQNNFAVRRSCKL